MARFLRRFVGWRRGFRATGVAVSELGGVRLLRPLVELGAGLCPIGTVGLLGPVRDLGHLAPAGRVGVWFHRGRIRGSRLRLGQLGVLGPLRCFGLPAGERWHPGCRRAAAQLGIVGVVGILRSLGPVRAVGVHERVGTVSALGGFRLFGQLGVLGTVGFVRHPTGRTTTVGLLLELGARIGCLRFARPLAAARPFTPAGRVGDPDQRSTHRCRSEEGRAAGATRSEEGGS